MFSLHYLLSYVVHLLFFALLLPVAGCEPQSIADGTLKRIDIKAYIHTAPEPGTEQEKAAQKVRLHVSSPYEGRIKSLDILIYSDEGIKALEAYPLRSSDPVPDSLTVEVELSPGDKAAVAIANCPYTLDSRKLSSYYTAEQLTCRLEDEHPDCPLMSCMVNFCVSSPDGGSSESSDLSPGSGDLSPGSGDFSPGSGSSGGDGSAGSPGNISPVTVEMELLPLRGEVIVSSVCSSVRQDGVDSGGASGSGGAVLLEDARVRLLNINTTADILRTGVFHPTETISEGPWTELPFSIGIYSALHTFARLICYPFDGESSDSWTSSARLELRCTILGKDCTYHFDLPTVGRGCSVLVDIDIKSPYDATCRTFQTDRLHF